MVLFKEVPAHYPDAALGKTNALFLHDRAPEAIQCGWKVTACYLHESARLRNVLHLDIVGGQ